MTPRIFTRLLGGPGLEPAAALAGSQDGTLLLVDVRESDEHRLSRGPGSVNVPLGRLTSHLESLAAEGKPLAFLCMSGSRSAVATRQARAAGLDAHNVSGGMIAWETRGLPVERG
jgi:rhodanese-related sulfurtransferase